ncbi:hypothetical protein HL658_26320 [Azospirillum sp. RWY-5-1]|uniref:Uncharacterized protein n=1 Tax=Azospirillum oleiclasticum TaxID=2735135 RepID=A0ABX2TFG0_9PROT|nr:hypothetical protein [Azospirillum oleiclasticum]NYZ16070.1 hypothetical protein [Azospirillum oleiclasticum]NYZ22951.1 hypothetical protein [Azospirillum oleiclasticum]
MTTFLGKVFVSTDGKGRKNVIVKTSQGSESKTDENGFANVTLDNKKSRSAEIFINGKKVWSGFCSEIAGKEIVVET